MSIELAEKLKQKLTDKWVVVDPNVPELKRFADWTGKVKTVNMSCRALVEFDGPVDIGWYDIDPAFLTVVDAPKPKAAKEAKHASAAKPAAAPAAAAPAATGGGSPLDKIRAQQAAKTGGGAAPAAAPAAAGGSPLDKIRAQQAAKAAGGAAPAPAAPAAAPASGAKLSPMEQIRAQQAAKAAGGAAPQPATPAPAKPEVSHAAIVETAPIADPPVSPPKPAVPTTGPDGKPLSKIEQIRLQGAAKR
jgi:hypothetical protein